MRITSLAAHRPAPLPRRGRSSCRPASTIVRGPNEAGKSTIQRAIELGADAQGHELGRRTSTGWCPWDGDPDARHDGRADVHVRGRGRRVARGAAREVVPRRRRARCASSSAASPITDPARADEELAAHLGRADRGLLPLDGVGPPPRARRAPARRGRPARPAPGLDQRRRPRDQPRQAQARAGAPRPADAAASRTRAGSRSPRTRSPTSTRAAPGRRGRARSGSSTTATRSPSAREHRAEAETALAGAPRRCSRRRARPSA